MKQLVPSRILNCMPALTHKKYLILKYNHMVHTQKQLQPQTSKNPHLFFSFSPTLNHLKGFNTGWNLKQTILFPSYSQLRPQSKTMWQTQPMAFTLLVVNHNRGRSLYFDQNPIKYFKHTGYLKKISHIRHERKDWPLFSINFSSVTVVTSLLPAC